jgi:hypothetical protein
LNQGDSVSEPNNPVSPWRAWFRKSDTIRSVSHQPEALSPERFVQSLSLIQSATLDKTDALAITRSFWVMEKVSSEFFKSGDRTTNLADPRLPVEVRPIAHCGMGIGAVERLGFEKERLFPEIDRLSHPAYRLFAYESIGAMFGVYQPGPFFRLAVGLNRLGIIPMARISRPEPGPYLAELDSSLKRLISHGLGRLLYFRSHSLAGALRAARRSDDFDYASCVRGIAFALSMVNSSDVLRIMSTDFDFGDQGTNAAFERGLAYALVFWEWMSPGFLDRFSAPGELYAGRRKAAEAEIEMSLGRGYLTAFDLDTRK